MEYIDCVSDITEHFNAAEFACTCGCGRVLISRDLVERLEDFRLRLRGYRIVVHSGFRCCVRQLEIDGARKLRRSYHTIGQAADIEVVGVDVPSLHAEARRWWLELGLGGVGYYPNFVHLDIGPAREFSEHSSERFDVVV